MKKWLQAIIFICLIGQVIGPTLVYAQSTSSHEQYIHINASVPPGVGDVDLAISNDSVGNILPGSIVTVTIEYDASYNEDYPLTIQSSWHLGTVNQQVLPTVDGLQFISGSATTAFNETQPIVDVINKTITWKIPSYPSSEGSNSVTYKLLVSPTLTETALIRFPVTAVITHPVLSTEKETVVLVKNEQSLVISQTPTSSELLTTISPTVSSISSNNLVTPTQTQVKTPLYIISVREVGARTAVIHFNTNTSVRAAIMYGTSPNNLNKRIVLDHLGKSHLFSLTDLEPNQLYYFSIIDPDILQKMGNEVYTFTTAPIQTQEIPTEDLSASLTQRGNVLYYGDIFLKQNQIPKIFVLSDSVVDLHVQTSNTQGINYIESGIRVKDVLGISTDFIESEVFNTKVPMSVIGDELFTSKLRTPANSGNYELIAAIHYNDNSIREYTIGTLSLIKPLKVFDKETSLPIENATVTFLRLNRKTNVYEKLPNLYGLASNPTVSDYDGSIFTTLLAGEYKIELSHFGYEDTWAKFQITPGSQEELPPIMMVPAKSYLILTVTNTFPVAQRALEQLHVYFVALVASENLIYLMAIINTCMALCVLILFTDVVKTNSHIVHRMFEHHRNLLKSSKFSLVIYTILYLVLSFINAYSVSSLVVGVYYLLYHNNFYAKYSFVTGLITVTTIILTEIYISMRSEKEDK